MSTPSIQVGLGPAGDSAEAYRGEVDGLRAVAVLAVLFFHAGIAGFGGGFVGVDVFFVISGYLITRLILGQLDGARFSFARFYARRARRLFPAMFVTLAATLGASIAILSPSHLEDLSLSVVYTLLSVSNVLFWSSAGYFDIASDFKPLLHSWSLGVEEQFYLAWPISVFFAYRLRGRSGVLALVVLVGLSSLVAAEFAAGTAPDAAFFLTPFRMCELTLGAACLWFEKFWEAKPWRRETLSVLGLTIIAYAVYSYSPAHRFPGLAAMVPCAGAALVIVAGHTRLSGALLANRLAIGIGLISYSLYLVHWPLFALWRYRQGVTSTLPGKMAIIAAAILLATAMYFLVEQPFRRKRPGGKRLSDPAFGLACAGLGFALILPSVAAVAARGWPNRVAGTLRAAAAGLEKMKERHFADAREQDAKPFPAAGGRNAVIIGDSHAADLLTALMRADSQVNYRVIDIPYYCQPVLGDRPNGNNTPIKSREIAEDCRQRGETLRDNPLLRTADMILISSTWNGHGLAELPATIDFLKAQYPAPIFLLGARFFFTDPSAMLLQVSNYAEANQRFDASKDIAAYEKEFTALSGIANGTGVQIVDLRPYVCDRSQAGWFCPLLLDNGDLLYWDWHHWTEAGAKRVGMRLRADVRYAFLFGGPVDSYSQQQNSQQQPLASGGSPPATAFEGSLDQVDCEAISGWARGLSSPSEPVSVEILDGETLLATVFAKEAREDLKQAGKGDHAFVYRPPVSVKDGRPHSIAVRVAGSTHSLVFSPKPLKCP